MDAAKSEPGSVVLSGKEYAKLCDDHARIVEKLDKLMAFVQELLSEIERIAPRDMGP